MSLSTETVNQLAVVIARAIIESPMLLRRIVDQLEVEPNQVKPKRLTKEERRKATRARLSALHYKEERKKRIDSN